MTQRRLLPIASGGFTLVELVVIIVITGILAGLGGMLITSPIEGYIDLSRRAELVDAADNSLRRMQRDIRQALPNSIRLTSVGSVQYLELLHTVDGGLYRAEGAGAILDFTLATDSDFAVLGALDDDPSTGQQLVIYNISASGSSGNAYSGDNRRAIDAGGTTTLFYFTTTLAPFPFQSPYQRFFLVDQAVSYVCDPSNGTLMRYAGYAITEPQPTAGLGTGSLLANHVTACNFTYSGGSSQRAGLVTLQLALADEGETISLLQQTHVDNAP
jgi:MSHA biogenesis protein MshO